MFDYEKFEKDLVAVMEKKLREWAEENDDIYILSLDLSRGMESVGVYANTEEYLEEQSEEEPDDFWYYKYCEEEWELCEVLDGISDEMCAFVNENREQFSGKDDAGFSVYTESFDAHCEQMIDSCKKALEHFREETKKEFPKLLLAFNIREYLDEEERIEIFSLVNSKKAAKEYAKHVEDFG